MSENHKGLRDGSQTAQLFIIKYTTSNKWYLINPWVAWPPLREGLLGVTEIELEIDKHRIIPLKYLEEFIMYILQSRYILTEGPSSVYVGLHTSATYPVVISVLRENSLLRYEAYDEKSWIPNI